MTWEASLQLKSWGIWGELFSLFQDYLEECQQRVVLNGQSSSWEEIKSGVLQGSVFGPLLLLINVNDFLLLTHLFFSFVHGKFVLSHELHSDHKKLSDWAPHWKMKFNPDPNKQAQKVHFSNRTNKDSSLFITFSKSKVETVSLQKHLGLFLIKDLISMNI